ncbi:hypothetical protein OIDMADRAFT_153063 [Oidiodendron maius Zn]|uniref:L-xylulose reductase n=1 Tax=Oidiodendron maius (strain Zn) TaxID=913774 RepID=A0A0C3DB91_OIDMZ|nr:hypothetical protein OIDMADRAFT_153063 [Oidiodendron maius Zn]
MATSLGTDQNGRVPSELLSLFSLKGKTAIVSGGTGGIGLAIVEILADAGANVAILYHRNKDAIESARTIEQRYRVKCTAHQVNITRQEEVEDVVNKIVADYNGRLDIFVANGGIAWGETTALDSSVSHYHEVLSTNLDGVYYSALAAGKHWRRQAKERTAIDGKNLDNFTTGSFIATASMSGHIVNVPHIQAAYNVSKAGVIHLCKSLAIEWIDFARANSVSPGYVNSGLTGSAPAELITAVAEKIPMRRIGEPHELKGAYLYLASNASSFCTGTDILVDGGYCLL